MASRQNISGRKGGFGRGPLSKVYAMAQKQAAAARGAGTPPGTPAKMTAALVKQAARDEAQTPLGRVKAAAKRRGGFRGMRQGAEQIAGQRGMGATGEKFLNERTISTPEMSAPGQEDLTGGGPLVTADLAPPPEATPAVQPGGAALVGGPRPRKRAGAMRPRSTRPPKMAAAMAPAAALTPPVAGTAMGTPPQAPQPEAVNLGVSEAANIPTANAPGARSVRSRGLHRSGAVPPRARGL